MGRLFWKLFLFIWLAQMSAMIATGAVFWFDHRARLASFQFDPAFTPPPPGAWPLPPNVRPPLQGPGAQPPPRHPPGLPPPLHLLATLLASLGSAALLAWYLAKPIRHLREALQQASTGRLDMRLQPLMGKRRDELADLGSAFDGMAEQLDAAMQGQRRLLHDVSHEMRSPLARLQVAIGLAQQQPERSADSLRRIAREGERLNTLVGEVLTLSRLESGALAGSDAGEPVDMAELLDDVLDDARFEAAAAGKSILLDGPAAGTVRAPGELLQRAISNVLRNAIRHAPAGSAVEILLSSAGGVLEIVIADHGPGVPKNEIERIFTPFHRVDGQSSGEGYGLGLAIAQRLTIAIGGSIHAENRTSGGLAVIFRLPLAK